MEKQNSNYNNIEKEEIKNNTLSCSSQMSENDHDEKNNNYKNTKKQEINNVNDNTNKGNKIFYL